MREIRTESAARRLSRAEAERLVVDFEQSGLTRKAFSAAHSVPLHTLDYYRQRVRGRLPGVATGQLVPVDLVGATSVGSALRVELANGRSIVVEAEFDASHLKRLIAVLEV